MDKKLIVLCSFFVVVVIVIIVCGASSISNDKKVEKQAEVIIAQAKQEADRLIQRAKGMFLREQGKLFLIYPDLKEYKPNIDLEGGGCIDIFSMGDFAREGDIKVTLRNSSNQDIKPSINIIFFDRLGYVAGTYNINWWFSVIKPGETRFDEGSVSFYRTPLYYRIEIE